MVISNNVFVGVSEIQVQPARLSPVRIGRGLPGSRQPGPVVRIILQRYSRDPGERHKLLIQSIAQIADEQLLIESGALRVPVGQPCN